MKRIEQIKAQSLWVRLVLFFLLLSIIILMLFQIIFNYSLGRHLQVYISGREDTLNRQIVNSLLDYHEATGSWSMADMPLLHTALSTNTRLLLYDPDNRLIMDTGQSRHHMMMVRVQKPELGAVRTYQFTLEQDGSSIGELVVAHPLTAESSVWLQQDVVFRKALSWSLLWIGLIAISIALILGILFSRLLSRPLEEIAGATDRITRGDYSLQLPAYEGRELNILAKCINQLAAHLRELEKLRKRSVADISHELRTPLANLRSYVEALKDGVLPADANNMEILLEEIVHLTKVASDMDELSRAENIKNVRVDLENVNMNQFLEDKVASFQPLFQGKGVVLSLRQPDQVISSNQDPTALGKIISNLLENAYRYTEPGGKVEVTLQENPEVDARAVAPLGQEFPVGKAMELKKNDLFLIKISDSGIGIRNDYLPYIFERFFRVDPSREREQAQAGSGIGLTLVKELTRAAGGLILVSSQPGQGTTFYLYLSR